MLATKSGSQSNPICVFGPTTAFGLHGIHGVNHAGVDIHDRPESLHVFGGQFTDLAVLIGQR